jgi:hypothetical protein
MCPIKADRDTGMTRRKGEITRDDLKRRWPHHVAFPAEKVRREVIFGAAGVLSASPLLCVETHEAWLEAHIYPNMQLLKEHKKEELRNAA